MERAQLLLAQFIRCHHGTINIVVHIVGFGIIGVGVWQKSVLLIIVGAAVQELGHVYQYAKTRNIKDNPFYCVKPQAFFAYPFFILLILYAWLAK